MGLHHHHGHNHGDAYDYDHAHDIDDNNRWRVGVAAGLTGVFMLAEVAGGLISGSLALLADAGHMLMDFAALAMAWGAFTIAMRPATRTHTFGFGRVSVLAAFVNGLTLGAISIWIIIEAVQRFMTPSDVLAGPMFIIAVLGLLVNLVVFWILKGAQQDNLNIRGALLHVVGDLLGSVAAIIAALIIMRTGWMPIDPILSVLVALLILRSAWPLIRESAHILLEGAPPNIDRRDIRADLMAEIPEIVEVQHIHTWCITQSRHMLTLEALIEPAANLEAAKLAIKTRLKDRFNLEHATIDLRRKNGE